MLKSRPATAQELLRSVSGGDSLPSLPLMRASQEDILACQLQAAGHFGSRVNRTADNEVPAPSDHVDNAEQAAMLSPDSQLAPAGVTHPAPEIEASIHGAAAGSSGSSDGEGSEWALAAQWGQQQQGGLGRIRLNVGHGQTRREKEHGDRELEEEGVEERGIWDARPCGLLGESEESIDELLTLIDTDKFSAAVAALDMYHGLTGELRRSSRALESTKDRLHQTEKHLEGIRWDLEDRNRQLIVALTAITTAEAAVMPLAAVSDEELDCWGEDRGQEDSNGEGGRLGVGTYGCVIKVSRGKDIYAYKTPTVSKDGPR